MYSLIKNVIRNGNYKLSEIQERAKKLYALGDITAEQLDELMTMASKGVNVDSERPEILEMLKNMSQRIDELEARLATLEAAPKEDEGAEGGELDSTAEYDAWTPWDGLSDKYQQGAIVTHGGKVWKSVFEGQNVWEPGTAGTAALWAEYTDGGEV